MWNIGTYKERIKSSNINQVLLQGNDTKNMKLFLIIWYVLVYI